MRYPLCAVLLYPSLFAIFGLSHFLLCIMAVIGCRAKKERANLILVGMH
jgi:hypothetical protein